MLFIGLMVKRLACYKFLWQQMLSPKAIEYCCETTSFAEQPTPLPHDMQHHRRVGVHLALLVALCGNAE